MHRAIRGTDPDVREMQAAVILRRGFVRDVLVLLQYPDLHGRPVVRVGERACPVRRSDVTVKLLFYTQVATKTAGALHMAVGIAVLRPVHIQVVVEWKGRLPEFTMPHIKSRVRSVWSMVLTIR